VADPVEELNKEAEIKKTFAEQLVEAMEEGEKVKAELQAKVSGILCTWQQMN
jgi:hypothetical protein